MVPPREDLLLDESEPDSGLDIGQLLLFGIGRFRYWIVLFAILGGFGGLATGLMKPNAFSSEVKVLVRPGYRMLRSPAAILDPDPGRATGRGTAVMDEVELLRNPQLAERVVQKVGAQLVLQPYDPRSRDNDQSSWLTRKLHELQASWSARSPASIADDNPLAQQAATEMVTKNLRLVTSRFTDVITIYYTAHSPGIAKTIAEAFLEVARERHAEVFASKDEFEMVTKKYEKAVEKRDLANRAFQEHQQQCGIVDFDVQRGEAEQVIRQQQTFIDQDRIQLESIKGELSLLDERLESIDSEVELEQPTVAVRQLNPEYVRLQQALSDLQSQRRGLSGQFVQTSERFLSEDKYFSEQIEAIAKSLATTEEWLSPGAGGAGSANPFYALTVATRLSLELEQTRLLTGLVFREQLLKRYEVQLRDVMSCELVHRNHVNAIAGAQQQAATLAAIHTFQSNLATIDPSASLIVIQPATLPIKKDGPERLKTLLLGLALGLFGGLVFATLRQLASSSLRYPAEAETFLGIPVLGLVPESQGWRRQGRKLRHTLERAQRQAAPKPA